MNTEKVIQHYQRLDRVQIIKDGLAAKGIEFEKATIDDLSAFDEFHIGGHDATEYFLKQFHFEPTAKILDVGCGVGGPARFMAQHYGCHITGLDLTPKYIETGKLLSQNTGFSAQTEFIEGNACDMPFEDAQFDGATLIHASMNIPDKDNLYSEIARCIKSQGILAMYDILGTDKDSDDKLIYPVPWSDSAQYSILTIKQNLVQRLEHLGFKIISEENRSDYAINFITEAMPILEKRIDADYLQRFKNLVKNVQEKLCEPWIIIAKKQ